MTCSTILQPANLEGSQKDNEYSRSTGPCLTISGFHLPDSDRTDAYNLLRLSDGRDLAYLEWGDPDGFPAFYFHGSPSSRLEGAFADAAARKYSIRLIATDRPGYGRSSFQPRRRFSDWLDDVIELADALNIERFGVAGHSGGGPHLFACGVYIDSARLKFIGALGPWGPMATPEISSGLNRVDRFYAGLAQKYPPIMRALFAPLGWTARYWPKLFFKIMSLSVSTADKEAMKDARFLEHFQRMEREAFRQGSRGGAHEAMIAFRSWGFDIAAVRVPTYIWLGAEDVFVSNQMGHYLAQTIPDAELHLISGKGHFNIANWDDIFRVCRRHIV